MVLNRLEIDGEHKLLLLTITNLVTDLKDNIYNIYNGTSGAESLTLSW